MEDRRLLAAALILAGGGLTTMVVVAEHPRPFSAAIADIGPEDQGKTVLVCGTVTKHVVRGNHTFFTLNDGRPISVVAFRQRLNLTSTTCARGKVGRYEGELQVVLDRLEGG
ncbi:MAG: OB-fold nucleic acid binding domain-containing protein [Candidatus Aenigmarchaeota archaeon]|nr:OB-fold nucleic acid binding domain-containing protein [Candidatus Aenigmarchaeota archaeon]